MAVLFSERVRETSTTTGTGDFTLAGAVGGFTSFNSAFGTGSGNTFSYVIFDPATNGFEIGTTYLSAATTLVRNGSQTVIKSSNSNNPVNFGAGTKQVFATPHGKDLRAARFETISLYPTTPDGNLAAGTDLDRTVLRKDFYVAAVYGYCNVAPTGSGVTFDINDDGSTILSTKLTIDQSEKDSTTAATPYVLSSNSIAANSVVSVDCDSADSSDTAAGVEIQLVGYFLDGV